MLRNTVAFFLVLLSCSLFLRAQVLESELRVDTSVSSYIKEWTDADAVRLHVRNQGADSVRFVIETTVAVDGHALVTTAHGKRVHMTMGPGESRLFHCRELLPLRSVYFTDRNRMDRSTGRITVKGDLRICVALLDTLTVRSYAKPICLQRSVTPYAEAQCLTPAADASLPTRTSVALTWTPVLPAPPHVAYRVRIYACDSAQFLAQAVRTNDPVVDTVIVDAVRLEWLPPVTKQDTRYAWHVYSSDGKGTEYGMSTGYGMPSEFTVRGVADAKRAATKKPRKKRSTRKSKDGSM
ncbi:MAG: hypothetical protein ACKOAG_12215 [Candidatus Kapaibacterium sp.]